MPKRISITGPESVGKTTLAQQLAVHFQTIWVPEYARLFIENFANERHYIATDLLHIARQQLALENNYCQQLPNHKPIFCDTDLLVIKIWHQIAYRYVPEYIEQAWQTHCHQYALFLLLEADLPWQYDPQREHPYLRQYLFQYYKTELENLQLPFVVINGQGNERTQAAIRAINAAI